LKKFERIVKFQAMRIRDASERIYRTARQWYLHKYGTQASLEQTALEVNFNQKYDYHSQVPIANR
jgi:hypothetical protein